MRSNIFTPTLLLFLFCGICISAQTKTGSTTTQKNGLTIITFNTPNGKVTVNLPDKFHAGDVISGTVIAEPKGKKAKQKAKNKNVLNGYVIEIEKEKKPVTNKKITWKIPTDIDPEIFELLLKDSRGNTLDKMSLPFDETPRLIPEPPTLDDELFEIPSYLRIGEPELINGCFDGDASNSVFSINDQEVEILAEWPGGAQIVILDAKPGPTEIEIHEKEKQNVAETNLVDLQISAGKLSLSKGEQTNLNIKVSGLLGLDTPVPLHIANLTPGNIDIEGGNIQDIEIIPNEAEYGVFSIKLPITAKTTGGFSIEVSVSPCPELH